MVMRCELCREALSALLDDEDTGVDLHLVDRHLAGCVACRAHERGLGDLHRASRVRQAEPVPDLSGAILARIAPRVNPHDPVLGWLRSGLTFVGVLVVILSAALLVSNSVANPAHLAAWDLAFGGALLVAAWQPDRARGLLPMAVLLVGSMTVASLVEINDGHPATHGLVFHAAELIGVVLLALLARHRSTDRPRSRVPAT
jgi:predicted anti-sigma-YlaC factor YlaD